MKSLINFLIILGIIFSATVSCEKEPAPSPEPTDDSTAVAEFKYDSLTTTAIVNLNEVVDIVAYASGDELIYTWTIDIGTLLGSGNTVTFSACCQGFHNINCTVEDKYGASESKSIVIKVV